MPFYTVRTNCEYSITIEAASAGSAEQLASKIDLAEWDQAWAPIEAEED